MPAALPTVLNLMLADGVHRDSSGKYSILGVFTTIKAATFPATQQSAALYATLTEGYGRVGLLFQIVCLEHDEQPFAAFQVGVDFADPLQVVEIGLPLPPFTVPHPGTFRLQAVCNGTVLSERHLSAVLLGGS